MSNRTTLGRLRLRAIREADCVAQVGPSKAVELDEVNDYINDSYSELHDILMLRYGSDYFIRKRVIDVVVNSDSYPLPDDFMKSKAVYWLQNQDPQRIRMVQFMENERDILQSSFIVPNSSGQFMKYRCADGFIEFAPPPQAVGQVELRYAYGAPRLINDQDIIEMQVCNGWEKYMVVDVATMIRDRLNLNTDKLTARKAALYKRIEMVASDRDAGQPQKVTDVYASSYSRRRY